MLAGRRASLKGGGRAFRRLFRVRFPEHAASTDAITTSGWVFKADRDSALYKAAWAVANELCSHVHDGHIKVLGDRNTFGQIDIFEGSLGLRNYLLDSGDVANLIASAAQRVTPADLPHSLGVTTPADQPAPAVTDNPAPVPPKPHRRRGAPPTYDYPAILAHAFRLIRSKGIPDLDNDDGWRIMSDLEGELAEYIRNTHDGKEPAKSTLQDYAQPAIDVWNAAQADKDR
jgi:hypothetical protein